METFAELETRVGRDGIVRINCGSFQSFGYFGTAADRFSFDYFASNKAGQYPDRIEMSPDVFVSYLRAKALQPRWFSPETNSVRALVEHVLAMIERQEIPLPDVKFYDARVWRNESMELGSVDMYLGGVLVCAQRGWMD